MNEVAATTAAITTQTASPTNSGTIVHFSVVDFSTIISAVLIASARAGIRRYQANKISKAQTSTGTTPLNNSKRQFFLVDLFTAALLVPFCVMGAAPFYSPALEEVTHGSLKVFISLGAIGAIFFVVQEIFRPLDE
jgi:hypothetical protein